MNSKNVYFVTAHTLVYAHSHIEACEAAKKGLEHQHELDLFCVNRPGVMQLNVSDVTTQQDIDRLCEQVGAHNDVEPILDASKILNSREKDFLVDDPWTSFSLKSYLEERMALNEISRLRQRIFELEQQILKYKK